MQTKQNYLRTRTIIPNQNISFSIGTVLTVQKYFRRLGLPEILKKHKSKGRDISSLAEALVSYRLTENQSVTKASEWINRKEVLEIFELKPFEQRTLYRMLEIIGENREEILADIQESLFNLYDFEHTNMNMDWTSFVLYGEKCPIGKYGYSRDHRPDKKQIMIGISELANPINVPVGMSVREGNVNDQVHFDETFSQVKDKMKAGSLLTFDQGANRKKNLDKIEHSNLKYLTSRQLNKSDDRTWIKDFDKSEAKLVDEKYGVYGLKKEFPSRINYLFFSEYLYKMNMKAKFRKIDKQFKEAEEIQRQLDNNRGIPKRYQINNPLIDCEYSYQTRLEALGEEEAKAILKKAAITGREGFFCLVSNKNLTLKEALETYRQKDSIEKIFQSLKNDIDIKPLRVWTEKAIYGALIIGFLAQLFISLIRYEHPELKHSSPKSIRISLMNLTVTVEKEKSGQKRHIFSNFEPISRLILSKNGVIV